MPGFPLIRVNPIPILQKIGTMIFTHEEVPVSQFYIVDSEQPLTLTSESTLDLYSDNPLSARTVGD